MKKYFLFLFALLLLAACQKQPTANFNFDKSFYYAGETIHLTDASTNAHHWYWTMPDGTSSTNQNVDFVIDTNNLGGDKTFALTVTSDNGNRISTSSKNIEISQKIYVSDSVSFTDATNSTIKFIPNKKKLIKNGNSSYIYIQRADFGPCSYDEIYFYLSGQPSSLGNSVDSFRKSKPSLLLTYCVLWENKKYFGSDAGKIYYATSGNILNTQFNNETASSGSLKNLKLNGNLTIHF